MKRRPTKLGGSWQAERGFTLIEVLVTLTIMALLAGIVAPRVLKYVGSSKTKAAGVQITEIETALDLFRADLGRFPTAREGLSVLVNQPEKSPAWSGPYLKTAKGLMDPWGVPFKYKIPGDHGAVDVYSFGDGKTNGSPDETPKINSWQ